jgi:hypothetical protein
MYLARSDREKVGRIGGQAYERESDRQQKLRVFSDHNNRANRFGKRSKNLFCLPLPITYRTKNGFLSISRQNT